MFDSNIHLFFFSLLNSFHHICLIPGDKTKNMGLNVLSDDGSSDKFVKKIIEQNLIASKVWSTQVYYSLSMI